MQRSASVLDVRCGDAYFEAVMSLATRTIPLAVGLSLALVACSGNHRDDDQDPSSSSNGGAPAEPEPMAPEFMLGDVVGGEDDLACTLACSPDSSVICSERARGNDMEFHTGGQPFECPVYDDPSGEYLYVTMCVVAHNSAHCSAPCTSDEDCANAVIPMRCLMSCPDLDDIANLCWPETLLSDVMAYCAG